MKSILFCYIKAIEEEGTHGRLVASKQKSLLEFFIMCTCYIDEKNASNALHILVNFFKLIERQEQMLQPGLKVRMLSRILGHRYPKDGVEGCSTSVPNSDNRF